MLKHPLNIVCLGHVDSGKSTFVGALLSGIGLIPERTLKKNLIEAKKIKKESFSLAWNTDETSQERKRGITMGISNEFFETEKYKVTIIDCPGHKHYISNTLTGVTQSDAAILIIDVVDIVKTPVESGQTYEHVHLARIFGILEIIVCINKMDLISYSQDEFLSVCNLLKPIFKKMGLKDENIHFVPISARNSINVVSGNSELISWYSGPCVLKAIDLLKVPDRLKDLPLRISVSSTFELKPKNIQVFGKVESGTLTVPCECLLCPMNEIVNVTNLVNNNNESKIEAGNQVTMIVKTPSDMEIPVGSVISDIANPPYITDKFSAHVGIFELTKPILLGCRLKLHSLQSIHDVQILSMSNSVNKKSGNVAKPRILSSYSQADIVLKADQKIVFDPFDKNKITGRFVLRTEDATIGSGKFINSV